MRTSLPLIDKCLPFHIDSRFLNFSTTGFQVLINLGIAPTSSPKKLSSRDPTLQWRKVPTTVRKEGSMFIPYNELLRKLIPSFNGQDFQRSNWKKHGVICCWYGGQVQWSWVPCSRSRINIRLNPKTHIWLNPEKCVFRVGGGKFLGFMLSHKGIQENTNKWQVFIKMRSLTNLKKSKDSLVR